MKEGGFGLAIRKKFFTMSVVRDLEKLPKEVVKIPSMEDFKTRLIEVTGRCLCTWPRV